MNDIILVTFCLLLHLISGLCNINQCQVVCQKPKYLKKSNNIEIFLEFKKGLIRIPKSNYVEENRMFTLPNGQIIPVIKAVGPSPASRNEVSMRMPSEFTVEPVAANCASKEFLNQTKELRKSIKCTPRPVIVDVLSNEGQVFPSKVLTKQCSGLCNGQKVCSAVRSVNTSFPVQILYDDGSIKCSTILVPKDKKCRCQCSVKKENCSFNQTYEKKSCKCKCKNEVEQAHCRRKAEITQQHFWDIKSCSCVCMNETPCTTGTFWDKTRCRCSKKSDNG